jgi:thiamine-phosphate pyrophosphorylase
MHPRKLAEILRFYFITDDHAPGLSALKQAEIAIQAGATIIQYRNKSFRLGAYEEVIAIRDLCKRNDLPLIINDNVLLAKAVSADGAHLGQEDENPAIARDILGAGAIIGSSVHNLKELSETDLSACDYIGTGPIFPTTTKSDTHQVKGLSNLAAVAHKSPLPVVAIGGIDSTTAKSCFEHGASGIAVISAITRAKNPFEEARRLSEVCGCRPLSAPV